MIAEVRGVRLDCIGELGGMVVIVQLHATGKMQSFVQEKEELFSVESKAHAHSTWQCAPLENGYTYIYKTQAQTRAWTMKVVLHENPSK